MKFDGVQAKKVLQYVHEKYRTKPEFLWAKFPKNAILRHEDSPKWYAALLNIPKQKLGLADDGDVDILDVKCDPLLIGSLRDGKSYFPAYHMNKEHWITVLLDGSIPIDEIFYLVDLSHNITKK